MFKQLFRTKPIKAILKDGSDYDHGGLHKNLGFFDLTSLAIAAVIGAGIFSTIGNASANGGPAVSLLFIFTALACSFSALCYAEFASRIPLSGSAYTYTYASLGELFAWIIGWDLLMEYSVGNIAVAISWSDYFTGFVSGFGMHIPEYLTMDYLTAMRKAIEAKSILAEGGVVTSIHAEAMQAWANAPQLFGIRLIGDIPAFSITAFLTVLVYVGIKESKTAGNIMVLLKLCIILTVISIGAFYVNPGNWDPFAPNGVAGVLKGVSAVFFAYIGFDAISTTAEECKNPQRDLPRAMIAALIICTALYVIIALILTGMVKYNHLAVGDPLAFVFNYHNLSYLSGIIAFSAIVAMASVLLVFQIGQPRIWMSMSRDGLLPRRFSKLHPRFKTPSFSTIVTGVMVAFPSLFLNLTEVTDLTSIGTLFAFVLVCIGVLFLQNRKGLEAPRFKMPYFSSRKILPPVYLLITILGLYYFNEVYSYIMASPHRVLLSIYIVIFYGMGLLSIWKNFSLIPVLGILTNLYLMTELGVTNWLRFLIWLAIGLVIYFAYGYRNSYLNKKTSEEA